MANEEYTKNITKWRQEVENNLRRENGWLALAGLFWLRRGVNLIGSAPDSDIRLPKYAPEKLGTFILVGAKCPLTVDLDLPVEVNGVVASRARRDADQEEGPASITLMIFAWWLYAVQRVWASAYGITPA